MENWKRTLTNQERYNTDKFGQYYQKSEAQMSVLTVPALVFVLNTSTYDDVGQKVSQP